MFDNDFPRILGGEVYLTAPSIIGHLGHFILHIYRPQTKFEKVMFLQVSVCPHGGGGGVCAWLGGMRGCQ